jgi:hypothetical protein
VEVFALASPQALERDRLGDSDRNVWFFADKPPLSAAAGGSDFECANPVVVDGDTLRCGGSASGSMRSTLQSYQGIAA